MRTKFLHSVCVASLTAATIATMSSLLITPASAQQTASVNRGPSGLPLPRFVSLKSERVNMRVGPGRDYAVAWMYLKSALPLEIVQEYDNWRRVRDADGTLGWVHGSLLSGKRTAITAPWLKGNSDLTIKMFSKPQAAADVVAFLQPGVIANVKTCDGVWCALEITHKDQKISGYTNQADLWGAYPDEKIDD